MNTLFKLPSPHRTIEAKRDATMRRLVYVESIPDLGDDATLSEIRTWSDRWQRVCDKLTERLRKLENTLLGRDPETPEPERHLFACIRPPVPAFNFTNKPAQSPPTRVLPEFHTYDLMAWLDEKPKKAKRKVFAVMGHTVYSLGMYRGRLCEFSEFIYPGEKNEPSRSICPTWVENSSVTAFMTNFARRWKASAEVTFDPSTIKTPIL